MKTAKYVEQWQRKVFQGISAIRDNRCAPHEQEECPYLAALALYLDGCLMFLNAHAWRDLAACDSAETAGALSAMHEQSVEVGLRMMNAMLFDEVLLKVRLGIGNPFLGIICHAAAEIVHVRASFGLRSGLG